MLKIYKIFNKNGGNKMKKLISVILAVILVFGLAGCGGKKNEEGKGETVK